MVIELYVSNLYNQIRAISHREVAEIPDVEARYRAEAGSEKQDDINHCIMDAAAKLEGRCARWLQESIINYADNTHSVPQSFYYEFSLSERRAVNKDSLANAMNNFLLEYALSKFYSIVSQVELSNKHSLLALSEGKTLDEMLFTKHPPIV